MSLIKIEHEIYQIATVNVSQKSSNKNFLIVHL